MYKFKQLNCTLKGAPVVVYVVYWMTDSAANIDQYSYSLRGSGYIHHTRDSLYNGVELSKIETECSELLGGIASSFKVFKQLIGDF